MRSLTATLLFAAQTLFPAHPSFAQSSVPSSSCPCTLRGTVVDSVSGQPVPHALVKLDAPTPRAALTDSEGKFQFEGLPAGSATLEAERPGFLTQDPYARWYPASLEVQLAPDRSPVLLKLIPEGVIFGQVSNENGEPLEGFAVNIFSRGPHDKRLYPDPNQHQSITTDDEGKFRIAGLLPGSYYLALSEPQGAVLGSSLQSAAPMGYAHVFYPGVSDMSAAVSLKVRPGTSIQANFSLKRVPFIRLSGAVSGYSPQQHVFVTLQGPGTSQEPIFNKDTGSFQTNWLPPGVYVLIAQADGFGQDGSGISSLASLRVDATSSHFDLRLSLQPAANIPLVIHSPQGSNPEYLQSLPLALALVPKESGPPSYNQAISPSSSQGVLPGAGQLFFPRVAPGIYELVTESPPGASLYAESATWGSTDLFRDDLVLDSAVSVSPIEVVVRDDGATLSGTISSGNPVPPEQVVLLTKKRKRARLVRAPAGRFEASGLAPGVYRVFAVDGTADADYEDPAFLAKISSKIQEITLTPKQSASINLELATVEE